MTQEYYIVSLPFNPTVNQQTFSKARLFTHPIENPHLPFFTEFVVTSTLSLKFQVIHVTQILPDHAPFTMKELMKWVELHDFTLSSTRFEEKQEKTEYSSSQSWLLANWSWKEWNSKMTWNERNKFVFARLYWTLLLKYILFISFLPYCFRALEFSTKLCVFFKILSTLLLFFLSILSRACHLALLK